jgi:hypothetical protein
MADRTCVALHHAVRGSAVACDVRSARATLIAVARVASGVGVGGVRVETARAEAASPAWRGVEGMNAAATKSTYGMKTAAAAKTTSGTVAAIETASHATTETATHAAMETTTHAAMETPTHAAVKTTASATKTSAAETPAMARLRCVCENEPHNCAREGRGDRQ